MITVVDYGMGNLRNVRRAFEEIGEQVLVTDDVTAIASALRLVLPGVGSFGEAVKRIDAFGFREPLRSHVQAGKPLIGICLGMQLLYEESEESPGARGLGVMQGAVKKFAKGLKVPHIGWNDVRPEGVSTLFERDEKEECFYYVHSYYVPDGPFTVARTQYGLEFSAAVERDNIYGVQFHPEKSQQAGMSLLRKFLAHTQR